MPTYSYKCLGCGQVFDVRATLQEKEEGKGGKFTCPKCRSNNLKQEFSAANFVKNIFAEDKAGCCPGESAGDDTQNKKDKDDGKGSCCCR